MATCSRVLPSASSSHTAAGVAQSEWARSGGNVRFLVGDSAWAPTTADQAVQGLSTGIGDLEVDLTQLPTPADGETLRVPIGMGVGDLRVIVPRDTAVSAGVELATGGIRWEVDGTEAISSVAGTRRYTFDSDEVSGGAPAELDLQITMGAGQVRVVEEDR